MPPSKCALDAHEQPSAELRAEWKLISRLTPLNIEQDAELLDDPRAASPESGFENADPIKRQQLEVAFASLDAKLANLAVADSPVVYHKLLPGLLIAPALVPEAVQVELLDRLLHRDLADPKHQTNLHIHYDLPYPNSDDGNASFFNIPPEQAGTFRPKDPAIHKPLSARRVFDKRLHWVTLGGQYDWTNRIYPEAEPPAFPEDVGNFLEALYPETRAQAAIVNLYSPGDTMMMHRDVSEETDRGLISLSIGCDGLFMITPEDIAKTAGTRDKKDKGYLLLRLRSGDVIYMTEEARFAWHGVPKVIPATCPSALKDWPAKEARHEAWRGWLGGKRLNLNVRQMKDAA